MIVEAQNQNQKVKNEGFLHGSNLLANEICVSPPYGMTFPKLY